MESTLIFKAVNLLSQAAESRLKGYASQLFHTLTLVSSSPAKHKILMRAYSRSKADVKLYDLDDSVSVASTAMTMPNEAVFKETKVDPETPVKRRSLVKVPKLCLGSSSAERNVSYTKHRKTSVTKIDPRQLSMPSNLLESPVKAGKVLNSSMSIIGFDTTIDTFEEKPSGEHLNKELRAVASRGRTPLRVGKAMRRLGSAHNLRRGDDNSKDAVLRRETTMLKLQSNTKTPDRRPTNSSLYIEDSAKQIEAEPILPHEAEFSYAISRLTVRKVQEVKDCLLYTPEATEIGLSILILFADIDNSIEVTCSHQVLKSRRCEQVNNYFSVPGHVVSVCRRFIPCVKKGMVSLSKT